MAFASPQHSGTKGDAAYANYGPFFYTGTEIAITESPQSAIGTLGWDHTFEVGYTATTSLASRSPLES